MKIRAFLVMLLVLCVAGFIDGRAQDDIQIRKKVIGRKGAKKKETEYKEVPLEGPGNFFIRKRIVKNTRIPIGESREGTIKIGEKPPGLIEIGEKPPGLIQIGEKPPDVIKLKEKPPGLITIEAGRPNTIELGVKKKESCSNEVGYVIIAETNVVNPANSTNFPDGGRGFTTEFTEARRRERVFDRIDRIDRIGPPSQESFGEAGRMKRGMVQEIRAK